MVGLISILIILLGGYGLTKLDEELFPEVEFDGSFVLVTAGDMSAIEVERNITTPLEQSILGMDGVEDVNSTTNIGQSSLSVTIEKGRGDEVSQEISTVTNSITANIPEVTEVIANQMSTSASHSFFMDISGGDMEEMTAFAIDIFEPRIEDLPEISDVSIMGIQEYEMAIEFDREKLTDNGLTSSQVTTIIQQANSEATLGELSEEQGGPSIRWETNMSSVEDVENIKVPTEKGYIDLKDIAEISLQPLENSSYVWKNGSKDFLFVQIGHNSQYTQLDMADAIREEVQKMRDEGLIEGFKLDEIVSQADYVEDSINGVSENILIGGIIAIVVLLLFLRNIRATIIIGISIPTSILLTFLSMWILDYSLNVLTLLALGLGIGMMVDSSIVILESIYKKKEEGLKPLDAVISGTKEVSSAVIASMLTTIVVFLPMGLMGGDVGQFMILLSVTIAITLISSVIVAFTIIPSLSEKFLKLRKKNRTKEGRVKKGYGQVISWIVKKKRNSVALVFLFFVMLASSIFLAFKIPMTIMPDVLNRYAEIMIDLETGVSSEEKDELIKVTSETLSNIEDIDVGYIIDEGSMLYGLINMTKDEDITRDQKEVNEELMRELRNLEEDYPVKNVQSMVSMSAGQPVQVQVSGDSFETLQTIATDVTGELEEVEGIVGITNSIQRTSVEKVVELDEEAMEDAGLNEMQVQQFIQEAFLDRQIGEISVNEENVPLVVRWNEETGSEKELLDLEIPTVDEEKPLSEFVELVNIDTPNEIFHSNGERYITISADLEGTDLGTVNRDIQKIIDDFETPAGYTISTAGDLETQQELIMDLVVIFVISIFLVYLVMAVQFNNLAHPLIVMSIIPMTIVGVILGLFATQRELSIMSGMGIIMLIGIVLNNAILLIDRTNQLRRLGFTANEAIVQAGKDRIRPIFMTTLTTAGGMLPLALATGTTGNYQAPMATAIISGLLFATLITLVLIPSVYRLFHAIGNGFRRIFRRKSKNSEVLKKVVG